MTDLSVEDVAALLPHVLAQCFVGAPPSRYAPTEDFILRGGPCTCQSLREEIAAALMLRFELTPKPFEEAQPAPVDELTCEEHGGGWCAKCQSEPPATPQNGEAPSASPTSVPIGQPLRSPVGIDLSRRRSVKPEGTRASV